MEARAGLRPTRCERVVGQATVSVFIGCCRGVASRPSLGRAQFSEGEVGVKYNKYDIGAQGMAR